MNGSSEQPTGDTRFGSYYEMMTRPIVLTPADEKAISALLNLGVRCRGCGEKTVDGCLPGCTDND